ncbi:MULTISPECIES: hypothetical protein [Streptomyces]|uniref:Uncharacterized protein n=2 Tax=Streptomyces TaxID=1883 RepID=A0A1E7LJD7_9ACTN|nr:hypothetical protein [Streptomyces nanshensis]OEV16274.1 hypothetical protein AN221_32185 [Streptomyces nanshensis]
MDAKAAAGITALASLTAAWGGYAVARAKGQRCPAQHQVATEHANWLRDRQADACLHFMEQGALALLSMDESLTAAHGIASGRAASSGAPGGELWERARRQLQDDLAPARAALAAKVAEIRLMAPSLAEEAADFQQAVDEYVQDVAGEVQHLLLPDTQSEHDDVDGETWLNSRSRLDALLSAFAQSAGRLLATVPSTSAS